MNRIRKWFTAEVDALVPVLHETYRCIGRYQRGRSAAHEEQLVRQLEQVGPLLGLFAENVPAPKRPFFAAVRDVQLELSDRIIALDIAVGALHIEFAIERAYMHPVSARLRAALEAARVDEPQTGAVATNVPEAREADVLVRGTGASPGVAVGRVFVVRRTGDYRHLPAGAVVVAAMTRPELALSDRRPAAIVTDAGGALCHAAIVARELAIPAVVGTTWATQRLGNGMWVQVDGTAGEVRASPRDAG
jgi:phosphoenolpyruvate synthase/pyruvate phosphate dikinase